MNPTGASAPPNQRNGIHVTGRGVVAVVPDIMQVVVGVGVQRDSVANARADAATLASTVIDAIRSAGVSDSDLQTARFSIVPEYRHTDRHRILDGYRVTSTVRVTIREIDRAGDVIDAAVAAGGNDVAIENVSFAVENDEPARRRARVLAWNDAAQQAAEIAELAGVAVGTAARITETAGVGAPVPMMSQRFAATEPATPIGAGTADVAVMLEVDFTIATE